MRMFECGTQTWCAWEVIAKVESSMQSIPRATFRGGYCRSPISIPAIITFSSSGGFSSFLTVLDLLLQILGYHVHASVSFDCRPYIHRRIISTNVFGRKIIESFEHLILKIPVLKDIYVSETACRRLSPESKVSSFKNLSLWIPETLMSMHTDFLRKSVLWEPYRIKGDESEGSVFPQTSYTSAT